MSGITSLSLTHAWNRYEGPTWFVAAAVYGGWIALVLTHASLPWWIVVAAGAWLIAWHGSLQHETIDAFEHVPRAVRAAIAHPPLGIFFPFGTYQREHRLHHLAADHVAETAWDPETFYHDRRCWNGYSRALRAVYRFNQTLIGRLTIGPILQTASSIASAVRAIAAGNGVVQREWAVHAVTSGLLLWWIAAVAHMPVWQYVAWIAYPGAGLTMLRSFYEHRLADDAAGRTATIENRFPFGLLFLNNNYHAQHHAAPSLPWYRIPAAWHARRTEPIARDAFHFSGYGMIVRTWLLRPVFEPVEDRA